MSLYSLYIALEHASTKQGRVSTLTVISVHQGGEWVSGSAFVHLLTAEQWDSDITQIRRRQQASGGVRKEEEERPPGV